MRYIFFAFFYFFLKIGKAQLKADFFSEDEFDLVQLYAKNKKIKKITRVPSDSVLYGNKEYFFNRTGLMDSSYVLNLITHKPIITIQEKTNDSIIQKQVLEYFGDSLNVESFFIETKPFETTIASLSFVRTLSYNSKHLLISDTWGFQGGSWLSITFEYDKKRDISRMIEKVNNNGEETLVADNHFKKIGNLFFSTPTIGIRNNAYKIEFDKTQKIKFIEKSKAWKKTFEFYPSGLVKKIETHSFILDVKRVDTFLYEFY